MFKKMDEMEKDQSLKSMRVAYIYTVIFVLICNAINAIKNNVIHFDNMFFLLLSQSMVFFISHFYFKNKVGDPEGKSGLKFVLIAAIIGIIISLVIINIMKNNNGRFFMEFKF